jgi:hypothetical protein
LSPFPTHVDWSGVQLGAPAPGTSSDNNITINNTGNVPIGNVIPGGNALFVNATSLYNTTQIVGQNTEDIISGTSFSSAQNVLPCSGTALTNSQYVQIGLVNIPNALSQEKIPANANLTFCLSPITGIHTGSYQTKSVNNNNWVIGLSN